MSNKRWAEEHDRHTLYFTAFYDEQAVAHVWQDADGDWLYCSTTTKDDNEYLDDANDLSGAKAQAERIVEEYYTDEINYYTELLRQFKEVS